MADRGTALSTNDIRFKSDKVIPSLLLQHVYQYSTASIPEGAYKNNELAQVRNGSDVVHDSQYIRSIKTTPDEKYQSSTLDQVIYVHFDAGIRSITSVLEGTCKNNTFNNVIQQPHGPAYTLIEKVKDGPYKSNTLSQVIYIQALTNIKSLTPVLEGSYSNTLRCEIGIHGATYVSIEKVIDGPYKSDALSQTRVGIHRSLTSRVLPVPEGRSVYNSTVGSTPYWI